MPPRPALRLTVASPCSKDWNQMKGTAQKRFCEACRQHVYDLSVMPWEEVRALLDCERPPCVKFFQRADGTVLTADCAVGKERRWRRVRNALSVAATAAAAWFALLLGGKQEECSDSASIPFERGREPAEAPSAPTTRSSPPDERWMEDRRAQLGERERPVTMGRMHTMGVIRVIRDPTK
jgi:hypothetical protein